MRDGKIAKGSFYIFVSQVATLLMKIFLVFFLAKILGPSKYGQYSAILAFCLIIEVFFRTGLTGSMIKNIASEQEKTYSLVRFGFMGQFVWSAFVFLIIFLGAGVWSRVVFNDPSFASNLRIASLYFVPFALFAMGYCVLLGRRQFGRSAVIQFIWFFLRFVVVLVFVIKLESVGAVFYAFFIAALLGLALLRYTVQGIEKIKEKIDKKRVITLAFCLIISAVALRAVFQVDKIFIKNIVGEDDVVGIYALASNFSLVLQLFAMSLIATLFPSMATSFAKADMQLTRKYLHEGTRYSLLVLLPVSFALSIIARDVIQLVFGEAYLASVTPFIILIFSSAIFSFFLLYRQLMVSLDRQWMSVLITVSVFVMALVLNPLFIKRYGFIGAACATLTCSAAGALASGLYLFRIAGQRYPWLSLLRILFASIVCFCIGILVSRFGYMVRYSLYLVLVVGFIIVLYILRELTENDWITVKNIFSRQDGSNVSS